MREFITGGYQLAFIISLIAFISSLIVIIVDTYLGFLPKIWRFIFFGLIIISMIIMGFTGYILLFR